MPVTSSVPYCCSACGKEIFRSTQIVRETNLWDLGDYQAEAYVLDDTVDLSSLRRYDVSLHEGWYCCRFIAMRMTTDKFGTGRSLLVYKDAVVVRGSRSEQAPAKKGQVRLTRRDFDAVTRDPSSDKLRVVKFGAIWCPPCRLMDAVIARISEQGTAPEVEFFEVDSDECPELAARFAHRSIPYFLFFRRGQRIPIHSDRLPTVDGGIVGGMSQRTFEAVLGALLASSAHR